MKEQYDFTVYTDGGSRGNPGPAAYGFVIYNNSNELVFEEGRVIGINTNNVAEYSGIAAALRYLSEQSSIVTRESTIIRVLLDSQLAAMQLSGLWKIKNENLRNLFYTIKILEKKLGGKISYSHIRREYNKEADRLVNHALDSQIQTK